MRVLARAYAEHNERLRKFLSDNYGHVLREFADAFGRLLPHLEKEELYWRLDFIDRRADLRDGRFRADQAAGRRLRGGAPRARRTRTDPVRRRRTARG